MDDLYREVILDYYKNPRNFGRLPTPTHSFEMNNPFCGDHIRMEVEVEGGKPSESEGKGSRNQRIKDIKFSGSGCAISMASASMLTEKVIDQEIGYLQSLSKDDIVKMLGIQLTPTRLNCALLGLEVLHKAVRGELKK